MRAAILRIPAGVHKNLLEVAEVPQCSAGDGQVLLRAGDSFYFRSSAPHPRKNPGRTERCFDASILRLLFDMPGNGDNGTAGAINRSIN